MNHGQLDERLRGQHTAFPIFGQSPTLAQLGKYPFDRPSYRQLDPTHTAVWTTHNDQLAALIFLHPLIARACDTCCPQTSARPGAGVDLPPDGILPPPLWYRRCRPRSLTRPVVTHTVHDDMTFATIDIIGVNAAPFFAAEGRVHELAVAAGSRVGCVGLLMGPNQYTKQIVNNVQCTLVPPLV